MNKKFFCALTIAGMLMSPVSVLAEEMEEVEAGSVGGTDVEQASTITLDEVNFPDDNFRTAVKYAYGKIVPTAVKTGATLSYATADEDIPNSTKAKLEDLAKILTLNPAVTTPGTASAVTSTTGPLAADYDNVESKAMPFKNIIGIEYLTGLQYLSILNSQQLKEVDLSKNEDLTNLQLFVLKASGDNSTPLTTYKLGTDILASDLYSLTLPEETTNLSTLILAGTSQFTTLDLSNYTALETVTVPNNELAEVNVKGCASLTTLDVSQNDLVALDISGNVALTSLDGSNNHIYELSLPSGKKLTKILVPNNKLTTIDLSPVKGLTTLNVADNRLESLDISNNSVLANINLAFNHLAAFDVTGTALASGTVNPWADATATGRTFSPQYLYANEGDMGIDLASYDENFQSSDSTKVGWDLTTLADANSVSYPFGGSINKNGVLEFDGDEGAGYYYGVGYATPAAANVLFVNVIRTNLMNRLYNPNSGEHFYTKDLNEKDVLVGLGWQDEGIGWVAPEENAKGVTGAGEAVFRLYNPNAGDHHYTLDSKEKDTLVRAGWDYEGVGWYSAVPQGAWGSTNDDDLSAVAPADLTTTKDAGYSIEVYREYNPNAKEAGAHNYTTSENENDVLVSLGWLDEGIGWRALK